MVAQIDCMSFSGSLMANRSSWVLEDACISCGKLVYGAATQAELYRELVGGL